MPHNTNKEKLPSLIRAVALVTLFGFLSACSSNPTQHVTYSNGSKFGVVNLVPSRATHVNPGFTIFNRSEQHYAVDWNIPRLLDQTLTGNLTNPTKPISPPTWMEQEWNDVFFSGARLTTRPADPVLNEQYKPKIRELCSKEEIDALIVFSTFNVKRVMYGKVTNSVEGYGLWTQPGLGTNPAFSYANLLGFTINCEPTTISVISKTHPNNHADVENFVEPDSSKEMPLSEIEKTRADVSSLAKKVAKNLASGIKGETDNYTSIEL